MRMDLGIFVCFCLVLSNCVYFGRRLAQIGHKADECLCISANQRRFKSGGQYSVLWRMLDLSPVSLESLATAA
jgi:hypothetical protein